ncbi:Group 1 truncated hemoglobin GlbN [Roseimaritima multifibrata]|uniref:Group 1 truncated hemoglobin n=1 Tax=Roseimaritima multifibrata TaxID=1930274 RepID=A0A517MGB3_9BACT|nr:group 1 truncated hemoglobin [Roseimaritima multifibrata]QDS93922.1 Group 1 truncated hemoglobin GlbN [Roseimaritima multifibrata]
MNDESKELFERLGGTEAIAEIVNEMYRRVLADEELGPFFKDIPMDRVRKMQLQFLASALDGPVEYTGAELSSVHAGRGITSRHFAKFCGHFADAMEDCGASKRDVDDALARLATYKDKITGDSNVDG